MNIALEKPQRRKASKEVRRQQLIDAAMEVIAVKGISGATTAEVTKQAGLSLGIVSLHFGGMNGLLTETLRSLAREMRDVWAEAYSDADVAPAVRLRAIVDAVFAEGVCSPVKIAVWFAFFGEAQYRAIYREIIDAFDTEREEAIAELCAEVKREGDYKAVDPKTLATSIESLADGLWLSLLLYPNWMTPDQARDQVLTMIAASFPEHFTAPREACEAAK